MVTPCFCFFFRTLEISLWRNCSRNVSAMTLFQLDHWHSLWGLVLSTNKTVVILQLWVNSLAPGRFQRNSRKVIFQLILVIDGQSISCKIVLKWMPMDLTDGKSPLVWVMAWCRQVTSHYLSQIWPDLCRHMVSLGHNELISISLHEEI